jgi:hypothetical protein
MRSRLRLGCRQNAIQFRLIHPQTAFRELRGQAAHPHLSAPKFDSFTRYEVRSPKVRPDPVFGRVLRGNTLLLYGSKCCRLASSINRT